MNVIDYYNDYYDESERLTKGRVQCTERFVKKELLYKHITNTDCNILEIGCGCGYWSIELSRFNKNHNVVSVDISDRNIQYLNDYIDKHNIKNITPIKDDGVILSKVPNLKYKYILISISYHVTKDDLIKLLKKVKSLSDDDTMLFIDYLPKKHRIYEEFIKNSVDENIKNLFYYYEPKEFETTFKSNGFNIISNNGLDGITRFFENDINLFDEEKYNKWLKYLLESSEDESILGYSEHALLIVNNIR